MPNQEHLDILRQGVEAWNDWRAENPVTEPDLSTAKLIDADLSGANLTEANLTGVDLTEADLRDAKLTEADLSGANLSRADLSGADLFRVDLIGAYLTKARLLKTKLIGANLGGANLIGAYLIGANLTEANLAEANLNGASLAGADLSEANFGKAELENASLKFGQLSRCDFTGTSLTGAKLYGTARDDWIIEGVVCRYVYWDQFDTIRCPQDRDFAPAEFERIYKALPTIEYVFQNGMTPLDPLIMDRVVQAIREQNPEYDIQVDTISARGLAPSIKLTVQKEEQKEAALAEVTRVYEAKVHELAGRLDEARGFIQRLIDRPNSVYIENPTGPLAIGGSTINIDQHVEYITNLRDTVAAIPEDNPTFAKVAKKTALDIIGEALKDVAKGQVKKAAEEIIKLGKELGPVMVNTAAYAFFKSSLGQ